MSQTVTCPHCQTLLRSQKPIPAGANLRCPDCRESFTAPALALPRPRSVFLDAPFLIAVTVSVLLGGSIITATVVAVVLSGQRPEPVVQEPAPEKKDDDALAKERKALEEAKAGLAREKLALILDRAKAALEAKKYTEAEKLFREALELAPGDSKAIEGLTSAKTALALAAAREKDDGKARAEVETLLADARKAMADRKFALAVQRLEAARTAAPTNKTVLDLLDQAHAALDADTAEKKKLADFRAHMDAGKLATKTERFADAVKEYLAALRLMPDDLEAQQGQKQAEAKIAALADKEKRQNAFVALAARARNALDAKRFKEAVQNLEAAVRLVPDDRDAQRDLRTARAALARVKKENGSLLARADEAIKANRLTEARDLCDEAVKNWAEDTAAEKALRNADRLLANAKQSKENYLAKLNAALLLYNNGNYAQAVAAYKLAQGLMPADLDPLSRAEYERLLLRAQRKLNEEVNRQVNRNIGFDQAMRAGNAALLSRDWNSAIKYFKQALRNDRDNVLATTNLNKALYNKGLADGQAALRARNKSAAIDAFNMALDANPGDTVASNLLRQAQMLKDGPTSPRTRPRNPR
jgi:tetratricopeptide (TPR) repeat protein